MKVFLVYLISTLLGTLSGLVIYSLQKPGILSAILTVITACVVGVMTCRTLEKELGM